MGGLFPKEFDAMNNFRNAMLGKTDNKKAEIVAYEYVSWQHINTPDRVELLEQQIAALSGNVLQKLDDFAALSERFDAQQDQIADLNRTLATKVLQQKQADSSQAGPKC